MKHLALLGGYREIQVTGADPVRILKAITDGEIEVFSTMFINEITFTVTIAYRDGLKLQKICEKLGAEMKILTVNPPTWKGLARRPILVVGLVLLFLISILIPSRVFFLEVEGNQRIPDRRILDVARQCGMEFGASRRQVRSERVKNALLEALPELQWAGVNTYGCVAKISVRERPEEVEPRPQSGYGHIVAMMDGVITECTALRGTLLCAPGEAVTQGQVLISGFTDSGLSIRTEQAQGEIYGQTRRILTAVMTQKTFPKGRKQKELKKISVFLGKKRINLWKDSGICCTTCDRMYEEYYITLPGGFALPLGICVERYTHREVSESTRTEAELRQLLTQLMGSYLKGQMTAGRILNSVLLFEETEGSIRMTGEYLCQEMIGKMQRMEIGDYNGQNN